MSKLSDNVAHSHFMVSAHSKPNDDPATCLPYDHCFCGVRTSSNIGFAVHLAERVESLLGDGD